MDLTETEKEMLMEQLRDLLRANVDILTAIDSEELQRPLKIFRETIHVLEVIQKNHKKP